MPLVPLAGMLLCLLFWLALCGYLWQHNRHSLLWMMMFYLATVVLECLFCERRLLSPKKRSDAE